jgi:hypothetical protein
MACVEEAIRGLQVSEFHEIYKRDLAEILK